MMFGHVLIWWHAIIESSLCNRKACYISEAHTLAQTVAGEFAPQRVLRSPNSHLLEGVTVEIWSEICTLGLGMPSI
jgi:hypothetical protein